MGLFSRSKPEPAPAPAAAPTVSLTKGSRITLTKSAAERPTIEASNGWTAKKKDYDLKALVRYRDGRLVYVGAANADEVLVTPDGAVRHSGDIRTPGALETITITWHPDIASIALSSYSALENGTGSFREYGVYVNIANGPQIVGLAASDSSADATQYTLCFGEVLLGEDRSFTVVNLELYSKPGSENRVGYTKDAVTMDIGPVGQQK